MLAVSHLFHLEDMAVDALLIHDALLTLHHFPPGKPDHG
jgi:hypothetical protein